MSPIHLISGCCIHRKRDSAVTLSAVNLFLHLCGEELVALAGAGRCAENKMCACVAASVCGEKGFHFCKASPNHSSLSTLPAI